MKFAIMTLGCKVNAYESQIMIEALEKSNYKLVNFNEIADIYIINTCTVTNKADQKSKKMIRQAIKRNPKAIIVVVGCLGQVNQASILQMDDVDILLGTVNKSKIVDYLSEFQKDKKRIVKIDDVSKVSFEEMSLNNFDKTRAFVKIQDGCNNYCSYCIIPYARGCIRSKKPELVIAEIKQLVKNGDREIVLTGINTGSYGTDLKNYSFSKLLKEIVKIDKLLRIRISSIEVTEITAEFLKVLKNNPKLVDHMHIPLQSGSNEILKLMNRKYDLDFYKETLKKLRIVRPKMLITTDIIVGFPNETEPLFEETITTIKDLDFFKLHVFPYSKRDGTVASKMKNQIDSKVKKNRVHKLLELSKKIELKTMSNYLNEIVTILPEVYKNSYLEGHADNYLVVKVKGKIEQLNQPIKVLITEIKDSECIGTLIDNNKK